MRGKILVVLVVAVMSAAAQTEDKIDRYAVVTRNNPHVTQIDPLASLTVGNGHFAMTVDATGLQTFPEAYAQGVCLGTMSDWGWHSFPNTNGYKAEETLRSYDFGRGHEEWYSCQFREPGRQHDASEYLRQNAHRLHLGCLGLDIPLADTLAIREVDQSLDLWTGKVTSTFRYLGNSYKTETVCHPKWDIIATRVWSTDKPRLRLRFPYPTGKHSDDACDWNADDRHTTRVISRSDSTLRLVRNIDGTAYYVNVSWQGRAIAGDADGNSITLIGQDNSLSVTCEFAPDIYTRHTTTFDEVVKASAEGWASYWRKGGIVDFSHCPQPKARELERRVVLSQYLLAAQEAGDLPPQETGLTYNSWFGKFHLEMIWWHQAQYALWGHPELLDRSLTWYFKARPMAQQIAQRQGFPGVRWMKMTDPSAQEAPSNVGSFLIWQQPHLIYLAELLYRATAAGEEGKSSEQTQWETQNILNKYAGLVDETAVFMGAFATYDAARSRYVLKGCIPAQETLKADSTLNPPFELSYWHYALRTAQQWRERTGKRQNKDWEKIINCLPELAYNSDSLYLAAESATQTYTDIRFTSDHPAVLGAMGVLPESDLIDRAIMRNTLRWVWGKWNWNKTWGWDYPMVAMCAARLGEPQMAVDALLMDNRTNTYLINGHNYQDDRLRVYMPGNGGLLTAVAMMCAGWDGAIGTNPGFPADWDVRWEGLLPLP